METLILTQPKLISKKSVMAGYGRLSVAAGLITCFVLLTLLYSRDIASDYEYLGYKFSFKAAQFFVSLAMFFVLLYSQLKSKEALQYYVSVLVTLFIYIPNAILSSFDHGYIEIGICSFVFSFAPLLIKGKIKYVQQDSLVKKNKMLVLLFGATCGMILLYLVFFGVKVNWSLILLDEDIYEGRLKFGNQVASSIIFPYTYSLLTKFIIPIGLILSIKVKKWWFVIAFSIFQTYLFLLNPHKTVMFIFLVVMALSMINQRKHLKYIVWGIVAILAVALEFDLVSIENMIVRRVLFVPAKLNQAYYEVFANIKLYLSYSIFAPFVDYPLNESPAYYVSSNFYNNIASHSNNGILSSGYMNFGVLGVLGNIAWFYLLIKYLRGTTFSADLIIILLPTIFLLNSSSLLTALVTHGMWFLIFFAYINKK